MYLDSPVLATVRLNGDNLTLSAVDGALLHLQSSGNKNPPLRLQGSLTVAHEERVRALHIGSLNTSHDIWRFKW